MSDTLLQGILSELQGIHGLLQRQQRPPSHLSRSDREMLSRILPVVVGVLGSAWFTCRDLEEENSPALGLVLQGLSTKSVGRLFRRGLGHVVDDYLIERKDRELNVWVWRVVSCG
ncbi:MAG: hypothetical protein H0W08_24315 [Acidobacteria bacterium]|nr:hypothetical protein [Acidobacteriota bacterium]